MHTDYIFEKRGGDFVTPLFVRYVDGIAGHIVSIIDPTEEITVVDMSRLVAGVYLVGTGDKVVRLVKLQIMSRYENRNLFCFRTVIRC